MKNVFRLISFVVIIGYIAVANLLASDSAELAIKAYKIARIDEQGISEFAVTDALADNSSLNRVNDKIIVDEQIDSYLGNAETELDDEAFSEQILFSVRVAGTGTSYYSDWKKSYKVTMTFSQFDFEGWPDTLADSDIWASYQLGNVTGVFEATDSPVNGNEKIVINENGVKHFIRVEEKSEDLSFSWSVEGTHGSVSRWTLRAAVAMTIDAESYDSCKQYGTHSADVTVKLEVVE